MSSIEKDERLNEIQGLMRTTGVEVELKNLKILNEDQLEKPLVFHMKYVVPKRIKNEDDRSVVSVPAVWERYYLEMNADKNRKHPYANTFDHQFISTVSIPEATRDEQEEQKAGNSIFTWKQKSDNNEHHVVAQFAVGQESASDYENFREIMDVYFDALESEVELVEKKGLNEALQERVK